jgi:hypothetical protein
MNISISAQPILRLTEAADRLLAGLDDGSVEPAAVALADALDECISQLPDHSDPRDGTHRFGAVLNLIGQPSTSSANVAHLLADACDAVSGEGADPKVDPAVQVFLQHLVWKLGSPADDEDDHLIALQRCLDLSMAPS